MTVRPYEVDKGNIIRNVEVRPTITTAVAGNVVQEMNDVEEDSIEGEIIEIPLPYYQKEYKFNVRVMQSGNPKVQDTAYSVLRIKPREPQTPPEFPRERVEIKLYRGWNLINLPGKLVSFESDSSLARKLLGFVYLKEEQRYVSIKEAQNILGSEFREYLATNAFWVYSYSEHALKVNIDREISFDGMKLSPNWNLIPITEDMVGGYLGDIIGECEFEKLYMWNAPMQEWEKLNKEYVFRGFEANKGIIVKSADYCRLGGVTITAIEPPTMP